MGVYYPCGVRRLRARLRRGRPRRGALCPPDRPLWSPGPPPRAARACDPEIISPPAWGTPEIAALAWPEPPPGRASWGVLSQNHVRLGLPGLPGSQDRPQGAARACDPEIISLRGGNCPKIAPRAGGSGPSGGPRSAPGSLLGALPRDCGPGRALWGLLGPHTGAGAARPADPRPMRLA